MKEFCTPSPGQVEFYHSASATFRAPVAVSACLTGLPVRYDGQDKRLTLISAWLSDALQLIPICPEVGAGLGVPRPPVQLVATDPASPPRALGRDDPALDVSAALRRQALHSARQLRGDQRLCGYLWKSRSPSCGLNSTPLLNPSGDQIGLTSGIQARLFQKHMPWLAHAEESSLKTPEDAGYFVWRCRLVFDVMYAGRSELSDLHRHYQTWLTLLPGGRRRALDDLALAGRPRPYLATLHETLSNIPSGRWCDLFD